jgi:multiple sugar transport system permease protein
MKTFYFSFSYILKRCLLYVMFLLLLLSLLPAINPTAPKELRIALLVGIFLEIALIITDNVLRSASRKKGMPEFKCMPHKKAKSAYTYIMLLVLLFIMLIPFYVVIITSIKTSQEANLVDFTWWPTMGIDLGSYKDVWTAKTSGTTLQSSFFNTIITALPTSVITVFASSLSAYAFAKLEFRGKKFLFNLLMFSMMAPACITLTTSYVLYDTIGWVNTFFPLIVPSLFGGASIVFFLRQYYMGIPNELIESAKIDGQGKMGIFFRIITPLSVPAYIAQFILTFIAKYNDYLGPLLYLQRPKLYTLSVYLKFFSGSTSAQAEIVAAACAITILPLVMIYFIFQKKILDGVAMSSGLKV